MYSINTRKYLKAHHFFTRILLNKVTENPNVDRSSKPSGLVGRDPLPKQKDLAKIAVDLDRTGRSTIARDEIGNLIRK
jgi:hypothetical protein